MPSADAPQTYSLIYGIDMRPAHEVDGVTDAQLTLTDGSNAHITMHLLEGSREQIKAMLFASVDAYFDIYEEM